MRIRKNAKYLTDAEKEALVRAFVQLKVQIMPGVTPTMSVYDYFVLLHVAVQRVVLAGETMTRNFAHGNSSFLPWHREFLWRMENALRASIPGVTDNVTIPYWDWSYTPPTVSAGSLAETDPVLRASFMGHNGGTGLPPAGGDLTGFFGGTAPAVPWWPAGLTGWRVLNRLNSPSSNTNGTTALHRFMGLATSLPSINDVKNVLNTLPNTYDQFRTALEFGPHAGVH